MAKVAIKANGKHDSPAAQIDLEQIETCGMLSLSIAETCCVLNIPQNTLYSNAEKYEQFRDSLECGRSKLMFIIAQALMEMAKEDPRLGLNILRHMGDNWQGTTRFRHSRTARSRKQLQGMLADLKKECWKARFTIFQRHGIKPSLGFLLIEKTADGDSYAALEYLERYAENWRDRDRYPDEDN